MSRLLLGFTLIVGAFACGNGEHAAVLFPSGVASGDVTSDSAILWTAVEGVSAVELQLSRDAAFTEFVPGIGLGGSSLRAEEGLVKTEVSGLDPDSRYYYRFVASGIRSRTGTFVTAPPKDTSQVFRFAFSGDSNSVFKPFSLLSAIQADEPAFFIYLGDTIYSDDERSPLAPAFTVEGYDRFYRDNRLDPHLQDLLAATSVVAVWDDHEVTNDYAGETVDPAQMRNGLTSFLRNFPVRNDPDEPRRLYRSFRWGGTAEFFVLDERQYRSGEIFCSQPDGSILIIADTKCLEALAAGERTFLGEAQKAWLHESLLESTAAFKFIVSELPITEFRILPYDRWEGYPTERRELLDFIHDNNIDDVYFLSTDIHANFVSLLENGLREFITGPIATDTLQDAAGWVNFNVNPDLLIALFFPSIEFHAIDQYGYGLLTVRPETPPSLLLEIKGQDGQVLYSAEYAATGGLR